MSVDAAAQRSTTRRSRRTGPRTVLLLLTLLLAVALAGCGLSGGSDESAQEGAASDAAGGAAPLDASGGGADAGSGADGEAGGVGAAVARGDAAPVGDRKIRRGEVTIEVEDLSKAAEQVRDRAAALGGYVSDESIGLVAMSQPHHGWPEDGATSDPALAPYYGPGEGRLVVRVPTTGMRAAMDELAAIGTELNRWSTETEVETALVDLESRVQTQTASVARLRALLEQATSLSDVVTLEKELSEREADLESLEAQLASLAGRAAMATVTVVLRTPDRAAQVDDASGFLGGLRAGWHALGESTAVLLTVLGAVLPFAVVAALVIVPLLTWRRRVRAARGARRTGSAPAEPA